MSGRPLPPSGTLGSVLGAQGSTSAFGIGIGKRVHTVLSRHRITAKPAEERGRDAGSTRPA
jgi:hypothetical protein